MSFTRINNRVPLDIDFIFDPIFRRYPVNDVSHARLALARIKGRIPPPKFLRDHANELKMLDLRHEYVSGRIEIDEFEDRIGPLLALETNSPQP